MGIIILLFTTAIVIILYVITSIVLTVIFYKNKVTNFMKQVRKGIQVLLRKGEGNKGVKYSGFKKKLNNIIRDILNSLIIDNSNKLFVRLFFFLFSLAIVLTSIDYNPRNNIEKMLLGILAICIFVGIGIFIERPLGKFYNKEAYFLKVLAVLIYPLVMFQSLLENFNTMGLLFTVIISVAYTFALIKNSIDIFSSLLFQYLNFFLVLILLNLLILGLSFGLYYFNYNDTFRFFSEKEIRIINNNGLKYIFYVVYVGISPFFSFPGAIQMSNEIMDFIPLVEYILGYLFNLSIVGFFISYSISKYFERRSINIKSSNAVL